MPALAITLPQFRSAPDATLEALEDGRRLGYAGGFVFDHLWPLGQPQRPALECWTLLAALAGRLSALAGEPGASAPQGPQAAPGASRPQDPPGAQAPAAYRVGTLVTRAGLRPAALLVYGARAVAGGAGAPPIVGIDGGD